MKQTSFNFEGYAIPAYCNQHGDEGMVDIVYSKRCWNFSCSKRPAINLEDSPDGLYCKHYSLERMADVRTWRCSYFSCMKTSNFHVEGDNIPVYCKQHADPGMVDIAGDFAPMDPAKNSNPSMLKAEKTWLIANIILRTAW